VLRLTAADTAGEVHFDPSVDRTALVWNVDRVGDLSDDVREVAAGVPDDPLDDAPTAACDPVHGPG